MSEFSIYLVVGNFRLGFLINWLQVLIWAYHLLLHLSDTTEAESTFNYAIAINVNSSAQQC